MPRVSGAAPGLFSPSGAAIAYDRGGADTGRPSRGSHYCIQDTQCGNELPRCGSHYASGRPTETPPFNRRRGKAARPGVRETGQST